MTWASGRDGLVKTLKEEEGTDEDTFLFLSSFT
jgi:hypothetical protein